MPEATVFISRLMKLKKLDVSNCRQLTNECISELVELEDLEELGLSYCCGVNHLSFPYLKLMRSLRFVSMSNVSHRLFKSVMGERAQHIRASFEIWLGSP